MRPGIILVGRTPIILGMTYMAGVGEDNVRDREEGGVEICIWLGPETDVKEPATVMVPVVNEAWLRDTNTDDGGADSADDGDEASDAEPSETSQSSR